MSIWVSVKGCRYRQAKGSRTVASRFVCPKALCRFKLHLGILTGGKQAASPATLGPKYAGLISSCAAVGSCVLVAAGAIYSDPSRCQTILRDKRKVCKQDAWFKNQSLVDYQGR